MQGWDAAAVRLREMGGREGTYLLISFPSTPQTASPQCAVVLATMESQRSIRSMHA